MKNYVFIQPEWFQQLIIKTLNIRRAGKTRPKKGERFSSLFGCEKSRMEHNHKNHLIKHKERKLPGFHVLFLSHFPSNTFIFRLFVLCIERLPHENSAMWRVENSCLKCRNTAQVPLYTMNFYDEASWGMRVNEKASSIFMRLCSFDFHPTAATSSLNDFRVVRGLSNVFFPDPGRFFYWSFFHTKARHMWKILINFLQIEGGWKCKMLYHKELFIEIFS